MRTSPRLPLLLLLLSVCLFPRTAFAQQETATMTGTVRDASGAVVPKATVTVTNIRTNIGVKTETDDAGFYTIPSLRPGEYSVTAESAGFSKAGRAPTIIPTANERRAAKISARPLIVASPRRGMLAGASVTRERTMAQASAHPSAPPANERSMLSTSLC